MRCRIKEKCNRDVQRLGDPLQSTCADPIDAFLIFLNLLKCHSDLIGKLGLRKTTFQPPRSDTPPHFLVATICSPRDDVCVRHLGSFHRDIPPAFNCESSTSSILSASLNDAQPVNFISRFFALALREGQRQHDAALMTFSRSASVEGIAFSPRAKFYLGVSNRVPP